MSQKATESSPLIIDIESQSQKNKSSGCSTHQGILHRMGCCEKPLCAAISVLCLVLIATLATVFTMYMLRSDCPSPTIPALVKLYTYVDDQLYWVFMGTDGLYLYVGGDNFLMIPANNQSLLFNLKWDQTFVNQEMGLYDPNLHQHIPNDPSTTPALFNLNPVAGSQDSWTISMNGSTDFLVFNPETTQILLQSQMDNPDAIPLIFYIVFGSFGALV